MGEAASVDNWAWCLESVRELLLQAEAVFNKEASSQVCREALETEEGATYMRSESPAGNALEGGSGATGRAVLGSVVILKF